MRQHLSLSHTLHPPDTSRSTRRTRTIAAVAASTTLATVAALSALATPATKAPRAAHGRRGTDRAAASPFAKRARRRPAAPGAATLRGVHGWPASATSSQAALALDAETGRYRLSVPALVSAERAQLDVLWRSSSHAQRVSGAARVPTSWTDSALHLSLSVLDAPLRSAALRHLRHPLTRPAGPRASRVYANDGIPASTWLELRLCESGDNYGADTGNGYYGAYQFLATTWWALGYGGMPNTAPPAVQDAAARRLLALQGWSAWPQCSARLGL